MIRVRFNSRKYHVENMAGRLGFVEHIPPDGMKWSVLWDDATVVQQFRKDEIELVDTDLPSATNTAPLEQAHSTQWVAPPPPPPMEMSPVVMEMTAPTMRAAVPVPAPVPAPTKTSKVKKAQKSKRTK